MIFTAQNHLHWLLPLSRKEFTLLEIFVSFYFRIIVNLSKINFFFNGWPLDCYPHFQVIQVFKITTWHMKL